MLNRILFLFLYLFCDLFLGIVSWSIFDSVRVEYLHIEDMYRPQRFLILSVVPLFWLGLYALFGEYKEVHRRYRLKDVEKAFKESIIGCLILFFILILNDEVENHKGYYFLLFLLFSIHFVLLLIPRLIITSIIVRKIHSGKVGYPTILVGGSDKNNEILDDVANLENNPGFKFVGYLTVNGEACTDERIPYLGKLNDLDNICDEFKIEEAIITLPQQDHTQLNAIIAQLENKKLRVKLIADMYDIVVGTVKMDSIHGLPLIEINSEIMPEWKHSLKRLIDIISSLVAIFLFIPLYFILTILVKMSSKGPVFYLQKRIGKGGESFNIIKFRTMFVDAEAKGPQLSSSHDPRITKIGRFLRKIRLDEFPQFVNVLKGDMSLVGPRPERQFFIDQITQRAPHYIHLQKVRPGITSWGQVKYGYAENVDQMIERLKFDVLYIENMSLALDFKILIYTILIILKRDGK